MAARQEAGSGYAGAAGWSRALQFHAAGLAGYTYYSEDNDSEKRENRSPQLQMYSGALCCTSRLHGVSERTGCQSSRTQRLELSGQQQDRVEKNRKSIAVQ